MITFVDTNVLLDVFLPDPKWGLFSKNMLETAYREGALVSNLLVYAELAPQFEDRETLDSTLEILGINMVGLDPETSYQAGLAWKSYRKSGGKRQRVLADFLIGAHASKVANRLLTRDRGFYGNYFKNLSVFYESSHS